MRILFITNYYPPAKYGWGYMQLCEEVANGLAARGHAVAVLTSTHRHGPDISRPYPVHRLIQLEPDWENGPPAAWQFFVGRRRRERQAIANLRQLVAKFQPDLIFVWHAIGIPRLLLHEAACLSGGRIAYYLADYQPEIADEYIAYWQGQPVRPLARWFKQPLAKLALHMLAKEGKPVSLNYENVACVSAFVRQRLVSQQLISPRSVVIHNGVNLAEFYRNGHDRPIPSAPGLRFLVAGRIIADKGIHTVIDGFAALNSQAKQANLKLTILGDGPADYLAHLKAKIQAGHLQNIIEFHAPIPREQMPDMLARYDVLIFPSEYDEPLARAMQEAMAMGLLVIGTTTGGSGELLVDDKTGLVFEAGNPESLHRQLARVIQEPGLVARLAKAGQQEVVEHFNIERTIEQVENYLLKLVAGKEAS